MAPPSNILNIMQQPFMMMEGKQDGQKPQDFKQDPKLQDALIDDTGQITSSSKRRHVHRKSLTLKIRTFES